MTSVAPLLVGLIAGGAYAPIGVRAPPPPFAALLGQFGMLDGQHPVARLRMAEG